MNEVDLVAFGILFLGILVLAYPLFLFVFENATKQRSGDMLLAGVIFLLGFALLIALWAVYYASTSPELLWPLAIFTLIFRFISPLIFVRTINKLSLSKSLMSRSSGRILTESFPGISMVIGTFILLSPYLSSGNSRAIELLVATILVIFTFTQFYLFLFADYIRKGSLAFAWIAGFLIGIGLVLMVPSYLNGFDSAFRVTSSFGWFTSSMIMMYGDKEPFSWYLKKAGW